MQRFSVASASLIGTMLFVALCSLPTAAQEARPAVSRELELPAIRIDCARLKDILDDVVEFVDSANISVKSIAATKPLLGLSDDTRRSFESTDWSKLCEQRQLPDVSTSVRFTLIVPSVEGRPPIDRVFFFFDDYHRSVNVQGTSAVQVDALLKVLGDRFDEYSVWYGGSGIRGAGAMVLLLFSGVLMGIILLRLIPNVALRVDFEARTLERLVDRPELPIWYVLAAGFSPMLITALTVLILPWSDMFPGMAVYKEAGGFLHRHSDGLNIVYLLLGTLLQFALPTLFKMLGQRIFRNSTTSREARATSTNHLS